MTRMDAPRVFVQAASLVLLAHCSAERHPTARTATQPSAPAASTSPAVAEGAVTDEAATQQTVDQRDIPDPHNAPVCTSGRPRWQVELSFDEALLSVPGATLERPKDYYGALPDFVRKGAAYEHPQYVELQDGTAMVVDPFKVDVWNLQDQTLLQRTSPVLERKLPTIVVIDSRTIHVRGGSSRYNPAKSTEVWKLACPATTHPQTLTWNKPEYLYRLRTPHDNTAVSFDDGRVLTIHGWVILPRHEILTRFAWNLHLSASSGATLTALGDHRALLAGGWAEWLTWGNAKEPPRWVTSAARVRELEVVYGQSDVLSQLNEPRWGHSASRLSDGSVVLAAGINDDRPTRSIERWYETSRRWRIAGRLRRDRVGHTATTLADGRLLFVGACDVSATLHGAPRATRIDVDASDTSRTSETWSPRTGNGTITPLNDSRCRHTATLLRDGRVLVAGGFSQGAQISARGFPAKTGTRTARVELYDPRTRTWTSGGSMLVRRAGHAAVLLEDGRVMVVGGEADGEPHLPTAEVYDPATDRWRTLGEMPDLWPSPSVVRTDADEFLVFTEDGAIELQLL